MVHSQNAIHLHKFADSQKQTQTNNNAKHNKNKHVFVQTIAYGGGRVAYFSDIAENNMAGPYIHHQLYIIQTIL